MGFEFFFLEEGNMDDFPPNSHKARAPRDEPKKEIKRVEKVVDGDVVRRKRPLGKRLVETFLGGDAKSVLSYLIMEVFVPAAKDTTLDMLTQGAERMMFGESRSRNRRPGYVSGSAGYVSYNRYSASAKPPAPRDEPRSQMSRRGRAYHEFDEIVLSTRVEAEEVIDRLYDLIARYQTASVADLYELVGEPKAPVDEKWGWTDLRGARFDKLRHGGYVLDLPKPEPLD